MMMEFKRKNTFQNRTLDRKITAMDNEHHKTELFH